MLIQFNFKNFKSFRDEVSLDLSATKITEHEDHVVDIANDKLLKVAAIYGANASGKSNVYDAFNYMSYYVKESFTFGDEDEGRRKKESDYLKVTPFQFDDNSRSEETTFEVFYVDNSENSGKIYQYGFSIKADEIVEEWLYSKAKTARTKYRTVFYRKKGEELEMNGFSRSHMENIKASLNKEALIVSLGAKVPELGYYLIVTDTEETEKNYFEGLRGSIPPELKEIVFDRDQVKDFDDIIEAAEKSDVGAGWSNPCFEICMYAYLGEMPVIRESYTCCDRFADKLEKVTGQKYFMKDKDIYRKLVQYGDEKKAIQIAERCCKKCVDDGKEKPSEMWPGCMVQRLVREIQSKLELC